MLQPRACVPLAVTLCLALPLSAAGEEIAPTDPVPLGYLVPAGSIRDGWGGFEALNVPTSIAAVQIDGRTYLLVAAYADNAVQVADITDPASPAPTASMRDGWAGFEALDRPRDIKVTSISGRTYMLVAAYAENAVQVADITDPASPVPVAAMRDGRDGFEALEGPADIEIISMSDRTYLLVAASLENAVQVVDITDPSAPVPVATMRDGRDGFEALEGPADIEIANISGRTYLLVAAYRESAVQVADVTSPNAPVPVLGIRDGWNGLDALNGPTDMAVADISGRTYALVAASWSNSIQVMDITDPARPQPASDIYDGRDGFDHLEGPADIEIASISGRTYLLVAAGLEDAIQVIDITKPALPVPVAGVRDGRDGFDHLEGPADIEIASISGRTYVMVASDLEDAVQIMNVVEYATPVPVAGVRDGRDGFDGLGLPRSVAAASIRNGTYLLVAAHGDGAVQVVNITEPASPVPVPGLPGGLGRADGPTDVAFAAISGRTYLLVAAGLDNAVQVIDITEPASPVPAAVMRDGRDGFVALARPQDMEVTVISDRTYLLVAAGLDNAVQVIDITEPTAPVPVAAMRDGRDGFVALARPQDMEVTVISDRTYLLVAAHAESSVQIVDITDPGSPAPVAVLRDGQGGFDALERPQAIAVAHIWDRTYLLVAAHAESAVQVADITDPGSPAPVAVLRDGQGGFEYLGGPADIETVLVDGRTYLLVAASLENAVQVVDVTNPASPVPAVTLRDGQDGFEHMRGPADVETVLVDGRTYLLVAASLENAVQVVDITGLTFAAAAPGPEGDGIPVYYGRADGFYHASLGGWVADNELQITGSYLLGDGLPWPHTSSVVFEACGQANARYDPDTGDITICYELIRAYADIFEGTVQDEERAVLDTIRWIFLHEAGHMVIDTYDIRITGHEESAADQFATIMMLWGDQSGADALLHVAHSFFRPPFERVVAPYWDTHLLDQQRYYNILCMVYGSDPDSFGYLADDGFLPEGRAVYCHDEYERAASAWGSALGRDGQ